MSLSTARKENQRNVGQAPMVTPGNHAPRVIACVDRSPLSSRVIPHAGAIAEALNGELSLLHVIEPDRMHKPFDPVEWDMHRREAQLFVSGLAGRFETRTRPIATRVLEGRSAEQIGGCSDAGAGDITALCRSGDRTPSRIGETARRVMENTDGSLLLVPAAMPEVKTVRYTRILVPLDGSSRAESALPVAVRIAAHHKAELVLVHATPKPHLLQSGPLNTHDMQLQQKLVARNERAGRAYLERIRESLSDVDILVHIVILRNGDARRILSSALSPQSVDLVVLSSHGHGGYSDVPAGNVSSFLLKHADIPVLMVRRPDTGPVGHLGKRTQAKGIRRPRGRAR